MRESWRTRVEMQADDVFSAMVPMSADMVATPGVMMFIGASLCLPVMYNLARNNFCPCMPRFGAGWQRPVVARRRLRGPVCGKFGAASRMQGAYARTTVAAARA